MKTNPTGKGVAIRFKQSGDMKRLEQNKVNGI